MIHKTLKSRSISIGALLIITSAVLVSLQYYHIGKNATFRFLQGDSADKYHGLYYLESDSERSNINAADTNVKTPKVLIYITTHMSPQHKEHLKHCWPLALKNSQLLNSSDIKVYLTPESPVGVGESIQLLKDTFKGQNFTYHIHPNHGYHEGAISAIYDAAQYGWFDGYDWVFRMNPDVIIQDDTWMLDTIKNDVDASLLYVECLPHFTPILRNTRKAHTDFFGLKLSALPKGQLLMTGDNAEQLFSRQIAPIIAKGQHRHIPDTFPLIPVFCRVNGNPEGPVFHFQDNNGWVGEVTNGICPATFYNLDENYNWL